MRFRIPASCLPSVLAFLVLSGPLSGPLLAQEGVIRGRVEDAVTRRPVPEARVVLSGGTRPALLSREDGVFLIQGLAPGVYSLEVSALGYAPRLVTDVVVQTSRPTLLVVGIEPSALRLEEITVQGDAFRGLDAAPTSSIVLGAEEVRRAPGAGGDVSKALLSLPGVSGAADNRNDLLVRGGAPSENAYYLDGIRIPQINHFATQGATGGALGLVNVDFIRETEFYTGGFPVEYGNALSSVLSIENRPGTPDGVRGDFTLGASEAALTLDGPAGPRANWLLSVRRSYLQFLFEVLGLPIRPDYWDAQFRGEYAPTERDRILLVGIGAIDEFDLVDPDTSFVNQEIFNRVLDNDQRSYTAGASWRRLVGETGVLRATASRSWTRYTFSDDDGAGLPRIRNRSVEREHHLGLRGEFQLRPGLSAVAGGEAVLGRIESEVFLRPANLQFSSGTSAARYAAFGQLTWRSSRLRLTAGLRGDEFAALDRGLELSPRASASLDLAPGLTLNAAAGRFTQAPSYLSLAVREEGRGVNRALRAPRNQQWVAGLAFQPDPALRLKAEAFLKEYDRVPVLRDDPRVSIANLGGDYGFVGAEPLVSTGRGRARGLELSGQRKLTESFYAIAAWTLSWSEFSGSDGVLKPSAWDRRNTLDLTGGYRIGSTWEFGGRIRWLSGVAVTPFDLAASALEYPVSGDGVPDYDRIGAIRTPDYLRIDLRSERRFSFDGWNGVVYLDLQNLTNRENVNGYRYSEDPALPDRIRLSTDVGLLPTFGFSIEF